MAKIVSRGEDVYNCDTCQRYLRLPDNPFGINVIGRCIITKGCLGSLHKVLNKKLISEIPTITPSQDGVSDWFQRKILYTHTQIVPTTKWVITHALGSIPIVQVFINSVNPDTLEPTLIEVTDYTITTTSTQSIIEFAVGKSGIAQFLALSSTNVQIPPVVVPGNVPLTNGSELTIATLNSDPAIGLTVRYTNTTTGDLVDVLYASVDNTPSVLSPWVGVSAILLNGKRYFVRSFNIVTTPAGDAFFDANQNRTTGYAISFPEIQSTYNTNVILLADSPYTTVDKTLTSYIDIASIGATNVLLASGELFAEPSIVRPTYPPILVL